MHKHTRQFRLHAVPTLEEMFLAHYEQMFEWALHLTGHDHTRAEDLVHDVFVQLRLGSQDFAAIENLEAYLFTVLRNLHRSQLTRAQRSPANPSLLVEYDSVEAGLQALHDDAGQRLQTLAELRAICRFVCVRKETAKAASALILRFFHGYYPSEITQMLCTSRQAVAELLRVARAEVKVFLLEPQRLGFLSAVESLPEIEPLTSENLTQQLRQAIYATRQGECLPLRHLEDLYLANRAELIDAGKLAHFVSCADCLERINRLLKLASLDDRDPPEMLGPDPQASSKPAPPKPTALKPKRNARASWQKLERRWRDVYEHDPTALRIAVNGEVLSSHKLHVAERNELSLSIEAAHDTLFIEIFSEQGVRLLFFHAAAPPSGSFEQVTCTNFSDHRTLEAHLNFCGSWPHLEIIYECGARSAECGVEEVAPQLLLKESSLEQGLLSRLYCALRVPRFAFRWVTITILLAALLITAVVGQKLGWWFAPAKPTTTSTPHAVPSDKPLRESLPAASPAIVPSVNAPVISPTLTSSASPAPSAANTAATDAMEIEALRLLQQAGADLGEQIEVKRTAQGQLRIEGLVESEARKVELQRALMPMLAHPAVRFQIETVTEALARQRKAEPNNAANASPAVASRIEIEKAALPIAAELQAYLQARGSAATDAEVQELATHLHTQARRAFDHLYALQRLTKQVSPSQVDALDRTAQAKFLGLLTHHAQGYSAKSQRWRTDLAAILRVATPASGAPASFHNTAELYRAITQLSALGKAAALALDQSLTIANQPSSTTTVKSPAFWRTVSEAENLASQIERYARQQSEKEP